jgi:cobalt-zinc-cadmium efflux system membrane fusion protein
MKRSSYVVAWLFCILLGVTAFLISRNRNDPSPSQPAQQEGKIPAPSQSPLTPREKSGLRLVGKVAFGEDYFSKVSSPVQGRVVDVRAKLGQSVQEGDVLLVIDSPDIAAAYADFLKEVSEFQFATRAYDLAKDLYETQALALKDLKQAENALVKEEAEYHQAMERLVALRVPRAELEKPLAQQRVMGRFELKTSLTGTIVDRTVTPGQWVGNDPSQVLLIVADLNRLQVIAEAYEQDLGHLHVDDIASVTVEAYPDEEFPARIAAIGDVVDRDTRTVKVRAWLNNDSHKLKPEMYAKLSFEHP